MNTRVCTACGLEKPVEQFPLKNALTGKRHARCKTCTAQISGKWYEDNKEHHKQTVKVNTRRAKNSAREFVYHYLLTHPCEICGETDPVVLEFHHVGAKDRAIGRMIRDAYSIENIAAEIAKCQVLCGNCHKRLTAKERGWFRWRGGK